MAPTVALRCLNQKLRCSGGENAYRLTGHNAPPSATSRVDHRCGLVRAAARLRSGGRPHKWSSTETTKLLNTESRSGASTCCTGSK